MKTICVAGIVLSSFKNGVKQAKNRFILLKASSDSPFYLSTIYYFRINQRRQFYFLIYITFKNILDPAQLSRNDQDMG